MRFLIMLAAFAYSCTLSSAENKQEERVSNISMSDRKVLLELFTSQGCSSCPSADALVIRLAQSDTNLVVVSFHVDYWDRLGWKDVFSSHDYTLRQQQYVQVMRIESAYTPQAVVQGQFEMVGSNQTGILNAVKKTKEEAEPLQLSLALSANTSSVSVSYRLDKTAPENCLINAVLVQKQSSTSVARGENSGRKLSGYQVARELKSMPLLKQAESIQLPVPGDLKQDNAAVVVFVQNNLSKKILAVRQMDL